LHTLRRFRERIVAAHTSADHALVMERYPAIYEAWAFYTADDREMRNELEARILAREPFDIIAGKLATTSDVVAAYEKYFFNVTDRLDSPSYITHCVLGRALQASPAERTPDFLWKLFGYWQGPAMVDAWVYRFNRPSRPETANGVAAAITDDFKLTMLMKADQLARTMPVNQYTRTDLLMTWCRLMEAEKERGSAGTDHESLMSGLQSVLSSAPWVKRDQLEATPADQMEAQGVTVRACEYRVLTGQTIPASFQQLVEHTHFPEPANANVTTTAN
jgi:hypothetical protein